MIKKVLIANRGEIACRIIQTLDRLGICSVAVYSDADRNSLHVSMATEAVYIGPAAASESYLNIANIVQAAKRSRADAVHPGYGFLSENPEFVRALNKENIIFIGPDADSIEAMGLKDAAKVMMIEANVPVVPGYHGEEQDAALLASEADKIGYPVLIKARAGGGGKGMRKVDHANDFSSALTSAQRESMASFGDQRVLIEKFVSSPRHIEVQVFGDHHGNVVHLNERDCSLQRRHQKVIEEAPAPGMTAEMRAEMGKAAVAAAQAVNYVGAGTVEFIVDASKGLRADQFYFMEMNTRLQVEHPVTEVTTNTDLVEWQIRVAEGKPLPLSQDDIAITGHAFEARIYAEDTDNEFLPATGTLSRLSFPQTTRIDTGVQQGDLVSPFYDPMIAKLIVSGNTRDQALQKLKIALSETHIGGCKTNVGFLERLCDTPDFVSGQATTALIENNQRQLQRPDISDEALIIAALLRLGLLDHSSCNHSPWKSLKAWRNWGGSEQVIHLSYNKQVYEIETNVHSLNAITLRMQGKSFSISNLQLNDHQKESATLDIDGRNTKAHWLAETNLVSVFNQGETWTISFDNPFEQIKDGVSVGDEVIAPMPGNIIETKVDTGDNVAEGDVLIQMEAMKMEHTLLAERNGIVEELSVRVGDQVEAGAVLLRLEPLDESTS